MLINGEAVNPNFIARARVLTDRLKVTELIVTFCHGEDAHYRMNESQANELVKEIDLIISGKGESGS